MLCVGEYSSDPTADARLDLENLVVNLSTCNSSFAIRSSVADSSQASEVDVVVRFRFA